MIRAACINIFAHAVVFPFYLVEAQGNSHHVFLLGGVKEHDDLYMCSRLFEMMCATSFFSILTCRLLKQFSCFGLIHYYCIFELYFIAEEARVPVPLARVVDPD
jgi:hypothetical protein